MDKEILIDNYKNIILGCRNSDKKPSYFVEDFLEKQVLVDFIVSTCDHESIFTKNGFEFIEEYYGLENIIEMVLREYPNYPFDEGISPREALLVKKQYAIDILVSNI